MKKARRASLCSFAALLFVWPVTRAGAAIKTETIPDLRPPHGAIEEADPQNPPWPWVVGAVLVLAGAALAWPRKSPPQPAEPPAARARREIIGLRPIRAERLGEITRRYFAETQTVPGPA